jgi:hypothetical protein
MQTDRCCKKRLGTRKAIIDFQSKFRAPLSSYATDKKTLTAPAQAIVSHLLVVVK